MPEKKCERCGGKPSGYHLLDWCAECSRDLCPACMTKGCCGHVPAWSGQEEDEAAQAMDNRLRKTGGQV